MSYELDHAAFTGNLKLVRALLGSGADINWCDGQVLRSAIREGHYDVVKHLLESGVMIEANGGEPLFLAILYMRDNIAKLLRSKRTCSSIYYPELRK